MKNREYMDKTGTKRFEITFDNQTEANTFYTDMLHRLLRNPRYYLDHLEECIEFQVSWINYEAKDKCEIKKRRYATSKPLKNRNIYK